MEPRIIAFTEYTGTYFLLDKWDGNFEVCEVNGYAITADGWQDAFHDNAAEWFTLTELPDATITTL